MHLIRAYAAVHRTRSALVLMTLLAVAGIMVANTDLPSIGDGRDIAGALAIACACGVAGALALICDAPVLVSSSARQVEARGCWIIVTLGAAVMAGSVSAMVSSEVDAAATARNVLFAWSLAVLTILLGQPDLAWVLPISTFGCTVLFTTPSGDLNSVEWWGLLLNKQLLHADGPIAIGLASTAALLALLFGGRQVATS